MGEIRGVGDRPLEWDPADAESVQAAEKEFGSLREQGYEFYEVAEARGKRVTTFDPKAGKLIAAPGTRSQAEAEKGERPRAMAGGPLASARTRL